MFSKVNTLTVGLIILAFVSAVAGQKKAGISGRVVDENGKSLSNALVSLIVPCIDCIDHIVPSMVTSEEGLFYHELDNFNFNRRTKATIYIEEKVPNGFYPLIYNPSFRLGHLEKYKGIVISISETRPYNLGDVFPTISYVGFSIDLSVYFPKGHRNNNEIKLSVKDFNLKIIEHDKTIPKDYWQNDSTIKLALPKGEWYLDLTFNNQENSSDRRQIRVSLLSKECQNIVLL